MAEVKFIKTTSDVMPEIVDGQFIAVHDTGKIYLDTGEERKEYGSSVKMYFDTDANILATDSTDTEALYYATDTGRIYRRLYLQDSPDGSGPFYKWLNINGINAINSEDVAVYGQKWNIIGLVKLAKAFQTGAGMFFSADGLGYGNAQLNVYDPNLGEPTSDSSFRSFYPTTTIDTMVGECVKNADIYTTSKIHIGSEASATGGGSVAIGKSASASGSQSIAIGAYAESDARYAIQLGEGVNSTEKSLAVGYGETDDEGNPISYPLLVGNLIPEERIPNTIARLTDVPNADNFITITRAEESFAPLIHSHSEYVKDTDIYTDANVHIGSQASSTGDNTLAIGTSANASGEASIAIGWATGSSNQCSMAIGFWAESKNDYAIQLGPGTNSTANSFSVGLGDMENGLVVSYPLLETGGFIPDERLSANIARMSDLENVGGSSWKSETYEDTTISQVLVDNYVHYYSSDLTYANLGNVIVTNTEMTHLLTVGTVIHFHSGTTATGVTCGNTKFTGLHCYAGTFTPQKNTRYTVTYYYNGYEFVASVGGYAG